METTPRTRPPNSLSPPKGIPSMRMVPHRPSTIEHTARLIVLRRLCMKPPINLLLAVRLGKPYKTDSYLKPASGFASDPWRLSALQLPWVF